VPKHGKQEREPKLDENVSSGHGKQEANLVVFENVPGLHCCGSQEPSLQKLPEGQAIFVVAFGQ
jgi:hypothetical protein